MTRQQLREKIDEIIEDGIVRVIQLHVSDTYRLKDNARSDLDHLIDEYVKSLKEEDNAVKS